MKYVKGRDNLSATIYAPTPCENDCPFCVNKKVYDRCKTNIDAFLKKCSEVAASPIEEIVISGGEPMADIGALSILLNIFKNKTVYINTSLIKNNFELFTHLVNSADCVKGINISRHAETYEGESEFLNNIVEDETVSLIKKPIRINTLIRSGLNIDKVLERWEEYNYTVCLRENFIKTTKDSLHTLLGLPIELMRFPLVGTTWCNVCRTFEFKNDKQQILYHKGLEHTCVGLPNGNMEVNDYVVYPDGRSFLDWGEGVPDKDFLDVLKFDAICKLPPPRYIENLNPSRGCYVPNYHSCGIYPGGATNGIISNSCGRGRC